MMPYIVPLVTTMPEAIAVETKAPFWRKEPPTIVDGTVVSGGMWPSQRKWWELPNFIKVLVGGFGSGKTMIGCKRVISLALQNAPVPVAAVSPTFPIARHTTIETISELLAGKQSIYGREEFDWTYHGTSHEFTFKYHGRTARILIYSGENPLSLRGPNLGACYIDEPFIQDEAVFSQMIARVRHPRAKIREIVITGTPEQLNWGYDLCEGELSERHDVGVVRLSSRENLALDSGYVTRLEGAFEGKAADAYIEGEFVNLSTGMVYYAFNKTVNVVELPIPYAAELGCGMDFNVNPMSAAVFWTAGEHMHFFDEVELPNADTEFMCDELTERYGLASPFYAEHGTVLSTVYPDATGSARKTAAPEGKSDFWYIHKAGYEVRAPRANPKRKDRYNAVNGKFKPKTGVPTLTMSPRCKKLIKYLQTHSHELMQKQQGLTHMLDAFGYPVAYKYPVTKETLGVYKLRGA